MSYKHREDDPYIFASFSKEDHDVVITVCESLKERGHRIYYDDGQSTRSQTAQTLKKADKLIVFTSQYTNDSLNIKQDINYALDLKKDIFRVIIIDSELDKGLEIQLGLAPKFLKDETDALDNSLGLTTKTSLTLTRRLNKNKRPLIITACIVTVLIIALFFLSLANDYLNPVVPTVVSLSEEEAEKALLKAGFRILTEYRNLPDIPKGAVASQSISGHRLTRGRSVAVLISRGMENIVLDIPILTYCIDRGMDKNRDGAISPDELSSLTELILKRADIEDISGLEFATGLVYLDLSGNRIKDISALGKLTGLETIVLDSNEVKNIAALAALQKLKVLSLNDNLIDNIAAVQYIASLQELHINNNYIADLTPLRNTTASVIYIEGNTPDASYSGEFMRIVESEKGIRDINY